jgi:hypothetical protein
VGLVVVGRVEVLHECRPSTDGHTGLVGEQVVLTQSQQDLCEVVVQVLRNVGDLRDYSRGMHV